MTPAEIKRTKLYRTLAPCIVKKDREELARMLGMVPERSFMLGCPGDRLSYAFLWQFTPQGYDYWAELSDRLYAAGHACW